MTPREAEHRLAGTQTTASSSYTNSKKHSYLHMVYGHTGMPPNGSSWESPSGSPRSLGSWHMFFTALSSLS